MFPNSKRLIQFVLLLSAALSASSAFATTFYVDYSSGNDSNGGTSKSTPFKHAPQMQGCTATCAATAPTAGDSIILKGGVTWPNSALGWIITFYGSFDGSNNIYVGVDKSWYTGPAWTRPKFNGGGASTVAGPNNAFIDLSTTSSPSPTGITFDNIEFTGAYYNSPSGSGSGAFYFKLSDGQYLTVENCYFHGWVHGAAATYELHAIDGDAHIPNLLGSGSSAHDNVFDGSDSTNGGDSGLAIYGGPPILYNNYIHNMDNGFIVNGAISVHDNTILNINHSFDGIHENCFEDNGDEGLSFYNNVCGHLASGSLGWWFAPVRGYAVNAWNNVLFDTDVDNVVDFANSVQGVTGGCPGGVTGEYCSNAGSYNLYNNTVECGPDSNPVADCGPANGAATGTTLIGNHFITGNTYAGAVSNCTSGFNCTNTRYVVQTKSTANGQGYTATGAYAFSPSTSSGSTVVSGMDLTSLISSAINALLGIGQTPPSSSTDTGYGCVSNPTNQTVSCPARPLVARQSGSWNIGAYQWSSTSASQPQPPTGLSATVN